jgi:NADPH-dependent 2,4-dienoyl-CoA reductase/sulfur reductase-like enzyme
MPDHLLIIGGVAGGMTAATWARRQSPTAKITVVERGHDVAYAECGMPYVFGGQVPNLDNLIRYQTTELKEKYQVEVLNDTNIEGLDLSRQFVEARNLKTNQTQKLGFDYLVLATGAKANRLDIRENYFNLEGVFSLRHMPDAKAIDEYLKKANPRQAVIIGAGYVGLEMAEALKMRGLEVSLVSRASDFLGTFTSELKKQIIAELTAKEIKLFPAEVLDIRGNKKVEQVVISNSVLSADIVIIAIGVSPEVTLAKANNIRLGASGAIAVKETQQTNFPNVYAAGDCAESHHLVLDKPCYIPLGTTANKQGRVAGINAVGGRTQFRGVVGTQVIKIFDLEVATTGLSLEQANKAGFMAKEITSNSVSRAGYYPGAEKVFTSLVYDERTGKLLGSQMIGKDMVAKRIDTIATALYGKLKIEDLLQLDLAYAPPFAPVWDPILYTVRKANI